MLTKLLFKYYSGEQYEELMKWKDPFGYLFSKMHYEELKGRVKGKN